MSFLWQTGCLLGCLDVLSSTSSSFLCVCDKQLQTAKWRITFMAEKILVSTMHVPRFVGEGKIDFVDKPVPQPGPGELLIQVKANALCGSERGQFYNGSTVTPGHEAAGVVIAVGPGTHTPPGTSGVVFLMDFCGECRSCKLGLTNQCLHKRA